MTVEKRTVGVFVAVILLYSVLILRLYALSENPGLVAAAREQSSYTLEVSQTRGGIYDRNFTRLTDTAEENWLAVLPSDRSIQAVARQVTGPARQQVLSQMQGQRPFLAPVGGQKVYGADVENITRRARYAGPILAPHLLGYLDGEGKGVSGIEAAYDGLLSRAGEEMTLTYRVDGLGQAMEDRPQTQGSDALPPEGVVLTLDRAMQQVVERATEGIEKGAAVVLDVQTGEILAAVSRPDFDPREVAGSLEDPDAPLYNRVFSAFNVGSTFKLAVAAAALEQGVSPEFSVECVGAAQVDGRIFYCSNRAGHQHTDLLRAIEQSCNPYFIALGQEVGGENILAMAQALGFGQGVELASGMTAAAGSLPDRSQIASLQGLANFSFGQGSLTATPLQIAAMVSTFANGGMAVTPTLVRGTTSDGKTLEPVEPLAARRVLSEETAAQIRECMIGVVTEGSGTPGNPSAGGAGGKTASAQTGIWEDGEEIVHAWFAGFFPAQQPRYAAVVLVEGGEYGGKIASPIFKQIADGVLLAESNK